MALCRRRGDGPGVAPGGHRRGEGGRAGGARSLHHAGDPGRAVQEILDGLERREAAEALNLWRGFGAFCGDVLGLEAGKVLAVVLEPAVGRVEDFEATAERLDLEADAEKVEEIRGGLSGAWDSVEGRAA